MPVFNIIVQKTDGSLVESKKEKESSAIKSAKMYVSVRGEPKAVVISNGKIVFDIPEGTRNDKEFIKRAMAHVKSSPGPTRQPPENLKTLAKEYDQAMKDKEITIPTPPRKPKPCNTMDILESACLAISLAQGISMEKAKKLCESYRPAFEEIAGELTRGIVTKDEAVQKMVKIVMQTETPTPVTTPLKTIDVSKVTRGHKGFKTTPTRVREDIGLEDELTEETLAPSSIPDGIVIYTKKENDDDVHTMIAYAMGYDPASLINLRAPANLEGYDYRRAIPLTRPTIKTPTWRAFGGRIGSPSTLIVRIQEKYNDDQVKVIIANGVELEK